MSVFTPRPRNVIINSKNEYFTIANDGAPQFSKNRNFAYTYDSIEHADRVAKQVRSIDATALPAIVNL